MKSKKKGKQDTTHPSPIGSRQPLITFAEPSPELIRELGEASW